MGWKYQMDEFDVPPAVFFAMIEKGALVLAGEEQENYVYDVNFRIVQEQFPSHMNVLIERSLNEIERWAYLEGYMFYKVLPNGMLEWRPTNRRYQQ